MSKKAFFKTILKYFLLYCSALMLFAALLFPFSDLGDQVSSKIAQATNNKVFITFENMSLDLLPTPGIAVESLSIDSQSFPRIEANSARFSPSILDLLKLKPGGKMQVDGLFGSQLSTKFTIDTPDDEGITGHEVSFELNGLDLKEIAPMAPIPITVTGRIGGQGDFVVDQSFKNQPEGAFNITSSQPIKFETLNIPQASLVLTDIEFSQVTLKGEMTEGEIKLDEVVLGTPNNDIYLQARGSVQVTFAAGRKPGSITPRFRRMDLRMKLARLNRLKQKDSFIANSIDFLFDDSKAKINETANAKTYQFRLEGVGMRQTRLTPLAQF
tara:strand:+ start:80048 stop:81028 length:981 start_codon:yes stop_codon:yes gene_type:complete